MHADPHRLLPWPKGPIHHVPRYDVCLQEEVLEILGSWVADPACAGNAMTLTVAGIIYTNEGNYVEALKACHTGLSLEMCAAAAVALTLFGHIACLIWTDCIAH
jgi:hypothetical protein